MLGWFGKLCGKRDRSNILSPHEALFVGDMVKYDYEGAKECDLKAFLTDRENNVKGENVEKISSLMELLELI